MSYILDALKKAERERGIQQIPTLMTDHAPRSANRKHIWISLSVLVVCVAGVAWYFLHSQQTKRSPAIQSVDPARGEPDADAARRNSATDKDSAPMGAASSASPASRPSGIAAKPSASAAGSKAPAAVVPGDAIRRQPIPGGIRTPIQDDEDYEGLPPHELIRSIPRASRGSAPPEPAKSQPESLKAAVARMTLSLLMYSDVKEERMVYINGSKYGEGEYVEDTYLIESITENGAILTYEGERALLQPKSK